MKMTYEEIKAVYGTEEEEPKTQSELVQDSLESVNAEVKDEILYIYSPIQMADFQRLKTMLRGKYKDILIGNSAVKEATNERTN